MNISSRKHQILLHKRWCKIQIGACSIWCISKHHQPHVFPSILIFLYQMDENYVTWVLFGGDFFSFPTLSLVLWLQQFPDHKLRIRLVSLASFLCTSINFYNYSVVFMQLLSFDCLIDTTHKCFKVRLFNWDISLLNVTQVSWIE